MSVRKWIVVCGLISFVFGAAVQAASNQKANEQADQMKAFMEVMQQFGAELQYFDPKAGEVYLQLFKDIIRTRNAAEATTWKFKVEKGLSPEEVEETMKSVANELNMASVGELPLYMDIEAKTGKPYRFAKIYMFCDSLKASMMMDYSDAFSAFLPCRITLIEDKKGDYWLYAMNMDLMLYGGSPLPPELKAEVVIVKEQILEIMERGAAGDF